MKDIIFESRKSYRHTTTLPRRGQRFGKWMFLRAGYSDDEKGAVYWEVQCSCGNVRLVSASRIIQRKSSQCKSCGAKIGRSKHEGRPNRYLLIVDPRLQKKWREIHKGLRNRCENPKDKAYKYYGARGIYVHKSVRRPEDFCRVIMALDRWDDRTGKLSLDRIDNDGPYAAGNLRMATKSQQNANKRPSRGPRRAAK